MLNSNFFNFKFFNLINFWFYFSIHLSLALFFSIHFFFVKFFKYKIDIKNIVLKNLKKFEIKRTVINTIKNILLYDKQNNNRFNYYLKYNVLY